MVARVLITTALVTGLALPAGAQEADEEREPPMILTLDVDGKAVPLELDKTIELETKAPRTQVTLRAEPYRVFNFGGLSFHYPRDMGFEAKLDTPGLKSWTLDGNDVTVMVQVFIDHTDHTAVRKSVIDALIRKYGRRRVKAEPSSLTVQGKPMTGTRLGINFAGVHPSQSVYSLQAGKDSVILTLITDDGETGDELVRMVRMLETTFQFREIGK